MWKYGPFTNNFYKKLVLEGNCVSTSASIVKKSFLIKKNIIFSEKKIFASVEDYDFFLNLALNGAKFKFFHKVLGKHFMHKNSFSRNLDRHQKAREKLLYHHIYNVQEFTNDKRKLLKQVKTSISIEKFFDEIKFNKFYLKSFLKISNELFKNPIYFINCFLKKIFNKLKTS